MRSHDAPPQSPGCAEGCHRPPQHPASGAGRSVSACTFVHARSASAHGWPVTVEPTSLGWLVLRDDGMPRTPIRPDRAAADRQACRSLQDRHCRGELARTQLPSQEIWLGLAPRQTQNASSARHTGRHHRCQRMPAARHPGLCRSLKAPADSGSPGRLGRGPHPGRISLRARPGHGDPLVAPPGRPLAQKACSSTPPAGSCRQSSSSPPRLPSSPRAHGWPCSRSGYLS
jgi:hypothetical protein